MLSGARTIYRADIRNGARADLHAFRARGEKIIDPRTGTTRRAKFADFVVNAHYRHPVRNGETAPDHKLRNYVGYQPKRSNVYPRNGEREMARRRRQMGL